MISNSLSNNLRRFFLLIPGFILSLHFYAQNEKIPFIFRMQEKRATKQIHKYLTVDTLIETSKATIHICYSNEPGKAYLLLLHGMGIDAKTNWYKQIPTLSKNFNLLVPDLIYFGKSTAKTNDYSVEFQVEQIHEALRILSISGKINVMGFSYGGLTAAVYNQLYASEVQKLIIIDGPVKYYSWQMADSLAHIVGIPSMTNIIVPQNLSDYAAMEKAVLSKKIPTTRKFKRKLIRYYFSPTLASRQEQLNYLNTHQKRYQEYSYNIEITPLLLIWGGKDGVVPVSVGEKLHHASKTSSLIVFKNAKHDAHFRNAKLLNRAVVAFLTN